MQQMENELKAARQAIMYARDVRGYHRRRSKPGSKQREQDLDRAMARVREAMKPLRSFLGKAPYQAQTNNMLELTERVRKASAALQSERRKLWKMQNTPNKEATHA